MDRSAFLEKSFIFHGDRNKIPNLWNSLIPLSRISIGEKGKTDGAVEDIHHPSCLEVPSLASTLPIPLGYRRFLQDYSRDARGIVRDRIRDPYILYYKYTTLPSSVSLAPLDSPFSSSYFSSLRSKLRKMCRTRDERSGAWNLSDPVKRTIDRARARER